MTRTGVLDHGVVGVPTAAAVVSWDESDVMLYALAVGAGQRDPSSELNLTTENTEGVALQALPSYALVLTQRSPERMGIQLGAFPPEMLVHAAQSLELFRPLPASGTVSVTSTVTGIYDQGSGALAVIESAGTDVATGQRLYLERSSLFVRGAGGFGGTRAPATEWTRPDREPDRVCSVPTRAEQALIYRLCGDHFPLHSDPAFAVRGGFRRPILHGLCTYGFSFREVISAYGHGSPDRLFGLEGRFTAPVFPGEPLKLAMWETGGEILFETSTPSAGIVLGRGRARFHAA